MIIPGISPLVGPLFGVHPYTPSAAGVATFDAWFGKPADLITVFISHSNWTSFDASPATLVSGFAGDVRPKVWTVPLTVTGVSLATIASGVNDSHFLAAAQAIFADAPAGGPIYIRLGHEFNLAGTYPWEVINSNSWAAYVSAFQREVGVFRSVSSRFRFIWNPNWITQPNPATTDLTPAYPGDAYVDVIGTDLYYSATTDNSDYNVAFNYERDVANCGLAWQVAFAAAHNKPLAMCEFATNWDKPQWHNSVYRWLIDNKYLFANIWDHTDTTPAYRISDDSKPDCSAWFKKNFASFSVPTPINLHTFAFDNETFSGTGTSQFSVVGGVAQITNVSNFTDRSQKNWTGLTVGKNYRVEMDVNTGGKSAKLDVIETTGSFNVLGSTIQTTSDMRHISFTFTATQSSLYVRVFPWAGDATQIVQFDNVALYAA